MNQNEFDRYYELARKEYIKEQRKECEKILMLCGIGLLWFVSVVFESIPLSLLSTIITYTMFVRGDSD